VRRELLRVDSGHRAAALNDEVDRCRGEPPAPQVPPSGRWRGRPRPVGRPGTPSPRRTASSVLVRPSWIETQGNVGEFGSHGSLTTPGSSLSCSKRSRATSLRRRRRC
jgi:hypothetical protein